MRPVVKIRYINFFDGFSDDRCRSHVLMDLCDEFDFVFCDTPDILLVGCYGQQPISTVNAVKVGYYTENLAPDLVNFDFFFGCEYSHHINNPRYCKRIYGPLQSDLLAGCQDAALALRSKTRFCNFIYSTRVPHRERFFKALNRYRTISAPGNSMRNCSDLSGRTNENWQEEKLRYLRSFKFTVAFENSRRIGYVTEKLYDAFRADTVPVYWGDPCLDMIVNREAVVVVDGDQNSGVLPSLRFPEKREPFRPFFREPFLLNKVCGRGNDLIDWLRARVPYNKGFSTSIEEVIALDRDDDAYMRKLSQPRLKQYVRTIREEYLDFWRKIIRHALKAKV
jgi:hypothetical protein